MVEGGKGYLPQLRLFLFDWLHWLQLNIWLLVLWIETRLADTAY